MAKKPNEGEGKTDIIKAHGVGLKISEWDELKKIATELGDWTLHAVSAYAIRYFLKDYRAGKIKSETKRTRTLPEL
jgi:hypothetical protein